MTVLKPQKGPQEIFLSSAADIAIYGGAAGGGKSFALLLEPLRHIENPRFRGVIFRRTSKQVRNEGGLWDASRQIYGPLGAIAKETDLLWRFPSGATISFGAMEHEKNRFDWQGTEITYLGFDELTHFSATQFFYLLSRNRSTSGIKPYVRATCNPDAESWLAEMVNWWIDDETGYAVEEKSGGLRWFVRDEDQLVWSNDKKELELRFPNQLPKSLAFVAANVEDNKILMERDAGYKSNLAALDQVERERLLRGNWKIRPAGGAYFKRFWFQTIKVPPLNGISVRGWDLAATEGSENKASGPDWTASAKVLKDQQGRCYILDVDRLRGSPHQVERRLRQLAEKDGPSVSIALPQDPGQAGKAQAQMLVRHLGGFRVKARPVSGSKIIRAASFSAQVEAGNVFLAEGDWNEPFLNELEAFPLGRNDDQVDAVVEAFNALQNRTLNTQREMY
jgi:predicted phage terminase large subunit-like protein